MCVCPSSHACASIPLVCLHVSPSCVCLSVLMYNHESGLQASPAPTILLGTALFLIRTDRLFVWLFTALSPFSRLLLSPLCQLDTWAARMQNYDHTNTQNTHLKKKTKKKRTWVQGINTHTRVFSAFYLYFSAADLNVPCNLSISVCLSNKTHECNLSVSGQRQLGLISQC